MFGGAANGGRPTPPMKEFGFLFLGADTTLLALSLMLDQARLTWNGVMTVGVICVGCGEHMLT